MGTSRSLNACRSRRRARSRDTGPEAAAAAKREVAYDRRDRSARPPGPCACRLDRHLDGAERRLQGFGEPHLQLRWRGCAVTAPPTAGLARLTRACAATSVATADSAAMVSSAARSGLWFARRMRLHPSFLKLGALCDECSPAARTRWAGSGMRTSSASLDRVRASDEDCRWFRLVSHFARRGGLASPSVLLGEDA